MKFNLGVENSNNGLEALLIFSGDKIENKVYSSMKAKGLFSDKKGEVLIYRDIDDKEKVALVCLGDFNSVSLEDLRRIFFKLAKNMQQLKEKEIKITLPKINKLCTKRSFMAVVEGFIQAEYVFDKYKSEKVKNEEITVNLFGDETKYEKIRQGIEEIKNVMQGVFLTRELVNTRAIDLYPETLANYAVEELSKIGVNVKVYNKEEIEKMGMKSYLSVARGSSKEPRFIVMEYLNGSENDEKVVLVGKGVTYDTGGYSLKPSDSMKTMFADMGGAGTVIGTMKALALNNVKKNVVAVVAATENNVSGDAYKPGDVISSLSGKSIEVDNTDAEGRLTLADAIYYSATELKADKIIDLATLTGACVVALGEYVTGAVTNNEEFYNEVLEASKFAGEPMWQLPTNDEFRALNNSTVADIKNTGGRYGGTITAGLFLEAFNNNVPWIHLDIAGTAYLSKAYGYLPAGATGVHVKTLYEYLTKYNRCDK